LFNAFAKGEAETDKVIEWCESFKYKSPDTTNVVLKSFKHETPKSKYAPLFDVLELADMYEDIRVKKED
jgi:hypothetical protein